MGISLENKEYKSPKEKKAEIKEKDDILMGTFDEMYKVEKKDPKNFYDKIININTFSQKPEIKWKIETKTELKKIPTPEKEEEKENKENTEIKEIKEIKDIKDFENVQKDNEPVIEEKKDENEDDIENEEMNKTVLGILGLGNVGKSYLLSFFIKQPVPAGYSIHTKGISIKNFQDFLILDSEGVEAALTKTNVSEELYPKEGLLAKSINESDSLIQTIARDKKAVESFIQDFIIEISDILIIVVGQLTFTEQKLIYRTVNEANKKNIFVIHNLKNLYSKEQILDYIENTFKKNVFLKQSKNFCEQTYKGKNSLKNKEDEFDKYYLEKYENMDGSEKNVIHLIMGSNVKESEAYYFNKTVSDFIQNEMGMFNENKKNNIFKEFKKFIVKRGSKYVESSKNVHKPFTEEDISIEKDGDIRYIKIKNEDNIVKKFSINQLGYSHFFGALFSPNFVCYVEDDEEKKEKMLIIDINAPGTGFEFDKLKKEETLEEGHKMILYFTGTKKLREYNDCELISSTMDSGNFRIDIILDCNKYKFKENSSFKTKKFKGLVRYFCPLIYDYTDNSATEMKAVTIDFSKKEKIKKEKEKEKNEK